MFGIHPMYLILVLALVLIVFGPGRLPEVGGAIGRGMREFRRASDGLTRQVTEAVEVPTAVEVRDQPERAAGEVSVLRLVVHLSGLDHLVSLQPAGAFTPRLEIAVRTGTLLAFHLGSTLPLRLSGR